MAGVNAALTHQMNHLIARQGVVSGNIANAATPGYVAKDLQFQAMVAKQSMAMKATKPGHLRGSRSAGAHGKVVEDKTHMQLNGNSVQIDQEMLKLNDIQLRFRLASQLFAKHASLQKMAIGKDR